MHAATPRLGPEASGSPRGMNWTSGDPVASDCSARRSSHRFVVWSREDRRRLRSRSYRSMSLDLRGCSAGCRHDARRAASCRADQKVPSSDCGRNCGSTRDSGLAASIESAHGARERAEIGEPTEAAAEYLMTIRYMHAEGQPVIAARLAERLGVSAATVSEMVTRLVREGLLAVEPDSRQLQPDRCRPRCRRAHVSAPRAVGVAADRGHRARLGRGRRGGAPPPERAQRPGDRPDRRAARPPADLPAREPDSARRPHAGAAGRAAAVRAGAGERRDHPARHRGGGGGRAAADLPPGERRAARATCSPSSRWPITSAP